MPVFLRTLPQHFTPILFLIYTEKHLHIHKILHSYNVVNRSHAIHLLSIDPFHPQILNKIFKLLPLLNMVNQTSEMCIIKHTVSNTQSCQFENRIYVFKSH